jgi:hypothetical protein
MITTASILATGLDRAGLGADVFTGGRREEYAGWLGDAILGYPEPPSFQNDDYRADLDAANITYYMRTKNMTLDEATAAYYREINAPGAGKTRADIFLEHTDLDYVKRTVVPEVAHAYDGVYVRGQELSPQEMDFYIERMRETAPDTYNFIKSLEAGEADMGVYAQ